jgi:hypothetical protein
MQLRTGKITGQGAYMTRTDRRTVTAVPKADNTLQLYKNDLKGMFDELDEWYDCPSARIAGMVHIYSYIDEYCENFKNVDELKALNAAILKSAETIMSDILRLAKTSGDYIVELLQQLATILVSVTAKLG